MENPVVSEFSELNVFNGAGIYGIGIFAFRKICEKSCFKDQNDRRSAEMFFQGFREFHKREDVERRKILNAVEFFKNFF